MDGCALLGGDAADAGDVDDADVAGDRDGRDERGRAQPAGIEMQAAQGVDAPAGQRVSEEGGDDGRAVEQVALNQGQVKDAEGDELGERRTCQP